MLECVDVFCGAGGLSFGLRQAGLRIRLAIDADRACVDTYRENFPRTDVLNARIQDVTPQAILGRVRNLESLVLAGGPPCQLFSRLNRKGKGVSDEFKAYIRLLIAVSPGFVVLENVPQIQKRREAWGLLMRALKKLQYNVQTTVLRATDFGVPQRRERLIVVASRLPVNLPVKITTKEITVREAIGHLPAYDDSIPNHRGMRLSDENLKRIQSLAEGDNSRPQDSAFRDSYARMEWDRSAPTITTKCLSFSNGRFGHPVYDRALTVREAAILQGFPDSFVFRGTLEQCARQVGNAVPPPVALAVGRAIMLAAQRGKRRKTA